MPLLGNFAAQSNNRKKRDLPASPVLCLSRLFNVDYLSTCSSIFACSKIDNNLVIVDLFDRCPRASERRRTSQQWTMRPATLACSSKVFARSNEKKDRSESHEAWDHILMSPDVVSLVSTDQNWWNQWIEVSVQGDREPVSLLAAPFYFLNLRPWQAAAGKNLMNVIESRKCTVLSWY